MTAAAKDYSLVLSRFRWAFERGGRWRGWCPVGGHHQPNLSAEISPDTGNLLVKCWAGCPKEEILQAVGLSMKDLFSDDPERPPLGSEDWARSQVKRKVVESYDYRDETGVVLYQVLRYDPKSFSQQRPDPDRPGKVIPSLGNVRKVLYRLPEVLARPNWPVLVAEGERKVHALERLGLLATCNCGGTGMGWVEDYSPSLAGRRVTVLPDNDRVGRLHADIVVGSLMRHGAASVRVVMLPGLEEHGDILDWLRAGGSREELLRLIAAVPEWKPR